MGLKVEQNIMLNSHVTTAVAWNRLDLTGTVTALADPACGDRTVEGCVAQHYAKFEERTSCRRGVSLVTF